MRGPCQKYLFMFINILSYFPQLSVSGMDISGRMQTLKADPRDPVVIDDQPHCRRLKNLDLKNVPPCFCTKKGS